MEERHEAVRVIKQDVLYCQHQVPLVHCLRPMIKVTVKLQWPIMTLWYPDCPHTHPCMHTLSCMHTHPHTDTCTRIHSHTDACIYILWDTLTWMNRHTCIHTHACTHIHSHRESHCMDRVLCSSMIGHYGERICPHFRFGIGLAYARFNLIQISLHLMHIHSLVIRYVSESLEHINR